jgi:PAS domain S-box-containing protein
MGVLLDNARLLDDLRESEERYRTLFEQSRDAIFISRRGQPMDCNQACLDLFGYRLDEVLELGTSDLYADPDDRAELTEAMHEQESVQDFAVRFKKKDGTAMDCLVTATLLRDEQGNEVGVNGIVRDITERIRAEEALRASEVEARRRADQVGAINDIAVTIGSILSLEDLLPYVVTLLRDTFGYYSVNIGLIEMTPTEQHAGGVTITPVDGH